ncbi:MAG: glycosyltransferase [Alphaproteobacteria bacterium]|nr:glycosyltransferase [Alphaproteobacteria bacterium]
MRIWLVTVGEPWPTDGDLPRLHRTGINAGFLAGQGHEIVSWSGTFDHASKTERTGHDVEFVPPQGYRQIGIHAGTYERNVSLKRIAYHRAVTRKFQQIAEKEQTPDIIVVSLTPLELARAAVAYGREANVPVVVDVRDMWPDIWAEKLPAALQPMRGLIFAPFYNDLKHAVRGATSLIGITESAIDWALSNAKRPRGPLDRAFPLVYQTERPAVDKITAAEKYWRSLGIGNNPDTLVGCFFGTFTPRVDFETPLKAVSEMPEALRSRVKLVLCGRGEDEALIRRYAEKTSQIVCHEWVHAPEIMALMQLSDFGLLPYRPTLDFVRSLPNKVFEYLNGGLPILTSLRGEVESLFDEYACGALYETQNPQSFAALVGKFVSERGQLAQLAEGARAAGRAYDPTSACQAFEAYLGRLTDGANGSGIM